VLVDLVVGFESRRRESWLGFIYTEDMERCLPRGKGEAAPLENWASRDFLSLVRKKFQPTSHSH
jgi:hypothetical protein